jgi:hypothetical protein
MRKQQLHGAPADNPPMHFYDLTDGTGVLELPGPDRLELELLIWWGDGEPTRAAWLWSQTGRLAGWAAVGEA